MIRTSCTILCFLILLSCNHKSPGTSAIEDTIQKVTGRDSVVVEAKLPGSIDYSLTGFYQSAMPCRNCDGSQQTLLLKDDASYKLHDLPASEDHGPVVHQGVWSFENGDIILFERNAVVAKYKVHGDTLLTVQRQGTVLSDSAGREHSLFRRPNANQYLPYRKLMEEGLLLYAVGTEPFWNLKMDSLSVDFQLADWKSPKKFGVPKISSQGDTIYISAEADSLSIQVLPEFCNDGMSDFLFEYRLRIRSGRSEYEGCGVVSEKIRSMGVANQ